MKLFISWSGQRSNATAKLLHGWVPQIINEVEPWMSDIDISTGGDWGDEIKQQLNTARYGIICVTPGNMKREWLLFEAGALSRQVNDSASRVAPFLIGFNEKSDLRFPLARFQATEPNKEDMRKLLLSINASCDKQRTPAQIDDALDVYWPRFIEPFEAIRDSVRAQPQERRSDRDLLQEILGLVRALDQRGAGAAPILTSSTSLNDAALLRRLRIPDVWPLVDRVAHTPSGRVAQNPTELIQGAVSEYADMNGLSLEVFDIADVNNMKVTVADRLGDASSVRQRVRELHRSILGAFGVEFAIKLDEGAQ